MPPKLRDRARKPALPSPMNWRPQTAEDLIGQAGLVARAQCRKAERLTAEAAATMKLLLYGPPGVGKTSVVELVALQLAGTPLAIEDYNGREVTVDVVRQWMTQLPYGSLFGDWSVKVVNELDRCSREAQDLLLTYLDRCHRAGLSWAPATCNWISSPSGSRPGSRPSSCCRPPPKNSPRSSSPAGQCQRLRPLRSRWAAAASKPRSPTWNPGSTSNPEPQPPIRNYDHHQETDRH